jgi:type I restriction enzyme S subunit
MQTISEVRDGFKETEIGLIPEDWDIKQLREILNLSNGRRPEFTEGGTYPVFGANGIMGHSNKFLTDNDFTLIIGRVGASGQVHLASGRIWVSDNAIYSSTYDKTKIDLRFLYFLLKKIDLSRFATKTTHPLITQSFLNSFKIPLPDLPEQQKIAFILSKIQQAIQQQDKIIEATKNLKKSLMHKLFTEGTRGEEQKETEIGLMPKSWKVLSISEIVEKTDIVDPRKNPEIIFKYIDVSSISREYLIINEYKEYKGRDAPSRARKAVKNGDIIFATVRPSLKRIAIIPESFDGEICSTAFCVIRCKKDVALPEFVFYYISTDRFVKRVSELQKGTNYPAVTDSDVLAQKIPLPQISEQQQIVESLSMLDRKMLAEERRKVVLQQLFKTMLNKLMTGEIRVKDLNLGVTNVS